MKDQFIAEHHIYQLLQQVGINTPKHVFWDHHNLASLKSALLGSFTDNSPVVLKGMADNLWHKSENGALHFTSFQYEKIMDDSIQMQQRVSSQFDWIGSLLTEKVNFKTAQGAPCEIFVSIQRDKCCGSIIHMGFGGVLAEDWAKQLKDPILLWPTSVYQPQEALQELKNHWLGKILLGQTRLDKPLLNEKALFEFLIQLWSLDEIMENNHIQLIEVNPFVVDQQGELVALDGVGLISENSHQESCSVPFEDQSFLHPKRIALAGVSDKKGNIGRMILENIAHSKLQHENILIIKPDRETYQGYHCLTSVEDLQAVPVDVLILALPAKITIEMIEQLCHQNTAYQIKGTKVVYIVAGGIGDGADLLGYGDRLKKFIQQKRVNNQWCPAIVGPNGLGMLLSPLQLNTLFIPQKKLNVKFSENSHVALISQSGAFLITRLSRNSNLSLKYGFSIGNQMDMKMSDFIALMYRDKSVRVLGLYVEGFVEGDVCAISKLVKQFRQQDRHVIIYKGGRSLLGQTAAAGHTGAMTGDYLLQKRLLGKAGSVMVETFNQFNTVFKWMTAYPDLKELGKLAIITNAGYETVGSVDSLGDNDSHVLYTLNDENRKNLTKILESHQLNGLVSPCNPLDLTPMANEKAYYDCIEALFKFGAGVIIVGLVPLSEQLDTFQLSEAEQFALRLKKLAQQTQSLIGIVIDAGVPYQQYKDVFEEQGFPVFDGMDMAILGINVLKNCN